MNEQEIDKLIKQMQEVLTRQGQLINILNNKVKGLEKDINGLRREVRHAETQIRK
jgi:outer membrane murein-binding lipoprotein Lpp